MKKVVSLSLILIIMISLVTSVYAESDFTLSLKPNKTEVSKDEEFSVELRLSNLQQDEKGIITLGATLDYDENSLEYVNMEGQGEWSKPSYNKANKTFITDRNGYAENNETIFKITFKVKDQSKSNLEIKLKDIVASNGSGDIEKADIKTSIAIKNNMPIIPEVPSDNDTIQPPNLDLDDGNDVIKDAPIQDNNKTTGTTQPIPNTGSSDNLIIIAVVVMAIASITTFIRMKKFEKEM